MMNAVGAAPYALVTAVISAMAVGGCTEADATEARSDHSCQVVTTHHRKDDEKNVSDGATARYSD